MRIDPRYFRPTEVDYLQADARQAREVLGWEPRIGFRDLVRIMVDADTSPGTVQAWSWRAWSRQGG